LARNRAVHSELCTVGIFSLAADSKKRAEAILKQRYARREFPSGTYLQGEKSAAGSIDCGSAFFIIR